MGKKATEPAAQVKKTEEVEKLEIPFTRKRVADLLVTSLEAGSYYWCRVEDYVVPNVVMAHLEGSKVYKYVDYPLCDGGAVIVSDSLVAAGKVTTVTLDWPRIKEGLGVMAVNYPKHFGDWMAENDDANTSDVFLQCCVFGELIYG